MLLTCRKNEENRVEGRKEWDSVKDSTWPVKRKKGLKYIILLRVIAGISRTFLFRTGLRRQWLRSMG